MQRQRRGNTAIIVSLSLVMILGVGAVVIDIGYGRLVRDELQNAADASALAAAAKLDGTADGVTAARETAAWMAAQNRAGGDPVEVDENTSNAIDGDVVLGEYDDTTGTFTASTDEASINAVQVRARVPALGLFVAPVALGQDNVPVSAYSRTYVSTGGASATNCFIPLAMPLCLVQQYGTAGLQNVTLKLQPAGMDNVGYGRPGATPNASWSRAQISNCEASGEVEIGDPLGLQNGQATSVLPDFVAAVENSATSWDTAKWGAIPAQSGDSSLRTNRYGRTYEGVVPVFDGGSAYCTPGGGSFNGMAPIAGFVWGAIYEVVNRGASQNRTIKMRLDFTRTYDAGSQTGGPEWGVIASDPPRMVPLD